MVAVARSSERHNLSPVELLCPAGWAGNPDEVDTVGAPLIGSDGAFATGSDFLMDGGMTAAYRSGEIVSK